MAAGCGISAGGGVLGGDERLAEANDADTVEGDAEVECTEEGGCGNARPGGGDGTGEDMRTECGDGEDSSEPESYEAAATDPARDGDAECCVASTGRYTRSFKFWEGTK